MTRLYPLVAMAAGLSIGLASLAAPAAAGAVHRGDRAQRATSGTVLLNETFQGSSAADPNLIPLSTACLTGAATGSTPPAGASTLGPCSSSVDAPAPGVTPGYLQLTDNRNNVTGGLIYNKPLPGNAGLVAEFESYQYGGNGADGISFFLSDGASQLSNVGGYGGALGYAALTGGADGVHNGYVGVGLDAYGTYNTAAQVAGGGCPQRPNENYVSNAVGIRGPGDGQNGYCYLAGTIPAFGGTSTLPGQLRGADVVSAVRKVRVTVSPDTLPTITVEIDFNDGRGYQTVLSHTMTTPVPATYKFGFAGSTGAATDVHLIRNITISSVTPLNQLNLVKQVDKTTAQPDQYKVGQTVPYQFLLTNTGTEALRNVTVNDPNVTPVTCPRTTLTAAATVGSSMVCTGTHVLTAADVTEHSTFTNTATANGKDPGNADIPSNPSSATVNVVPLPLPKPAVLKVTKSVNTAAATPGQKVTYTVRVTNTGKGTATGAKAVDDLSAELRYARYDGDAYADTGKVGYASPKLTWTGTLAPGKSATITYSVTVNRSLPGRADSGTLANTVHVTAPNSNCAHHGPGCSASTRTSIRTHIK